MRLERRSTSVAEQSRRLDEDRRRVRERDAVISERKESAAATLREIRQRRQA